MATREQSGRNVDQGVIQRVAAGIRYALTGVTPTDWFGPQQPLAPQAQEQTEGRAFDYPVGINLRTTPRGDEAVSFSQLRALADGYDLMRLIIEKRKDQLEAFDWEIVPKDPAGSSDALKGAIKSTAEFLERPDKHHHWQQWLRLVVEELLVIDTACVYPRLSRGGQLYGLELVDGATIKRVLDAGGRTPLPPDPAYQQILKGIPAADYSTDDLVYMMRNPRVWKVYGFSPVEQVISTVNIALRRQMSQLAAYTKGNVPEALVQAPESWNAKQIAEFQTWWDSIMEGDVAARRMMKFIPGVKEVYFPKKELLKDEYDEWLARIVCFCFSISPSALIKQVNRASGEQMADTAKEEGLMPLLRFVEGFMSHLIQVHLKQPGLKFAWKIVNRVAPDQQAQIHRTYADIEVLTPDEIREELGMDAMTPEQREKAWPTPVPAGFNPDGTPILPKGAPGVAGQQPKEVAPKPGEEKKPTPVEKMLDKAIDGMLAKAATPVVIEHRPEINVEVGDTNVHVPVARAQAGDDAGLAKRANASAEATLELARGVTKVAEAVANQPAPVVNIQVDAPEVNVTTPETQVTLEAPQIHLDAPITVNTPAPQVNAPVTVNVPPAHTQVDVHVPEPGPTEKLIESDRDGNPTRIVSRPLQ